MQDQTCEDDAFTCMLMTSFLLWMRHRCDININMRICDINMHMCDINMHICDINMHICDINMHNTPRAQSAEICKDPRMFTLLTGKIAYCRQVLRCSRNLKVLTRYPRFTLLAWCVFQSFLRLFVRWRIQRVTWLMSCVWHDSFLSWCIHMRDMIHMWCVTWFICGVLHDSCVVCDVMIHVWCAT